MLEWIGRPYNVARVKFGDPDYLKINPAGAAPGYLARRQPEARLSGGASLREKAEVDRWSHFLAGDLRPASFFAGRSRPLHGRLAQRTLAKEA